MKNLLSLVAKIHENGNRFIIEELEKNGAKGLVPSHGAILVCLYQNDKMTMKDIADKIHRTRPTVTVLIDKLEKLGFVKREVSNEDNRYTYIVLTKKSEDFKPVFENISNKLNNKLFENISDSDYQMLENLLSRIVENIKKE